MQDNAAFGLQVRVIASNTFPAGFTVSAFPGDVDPFDIPALQIADVEMGVNGDMVTWTTANAIPFALAIIPNSEEQKNMDVVFEANRPARGKRPAKDVITIVGMYADGSSITLSQGVVFDGMPGKSVASAGRYKSSVYNFRFEQMARVNIEV